MRTHTVGADVRENDSAALRSGVEGGHACVVALLLGEGADAGEWAWAWAWAL